MEIYADDVQCAHGATISQIDEKALYYMQSRGVDRASAELMLAIGFINEVVASIENDPLRSYVERQTQQFFRQVKATQGELAL